MGADASAQPAGHPNARRTPMVAAVSVRERNFWMGLAFAAVVHAALLAGFIRSPPRMMGEASGLADGISVELVEAPDPKSKNTFAEDGGQPGAAARPMPKPPQKQAAAEPQPPQPTPDPPLRVEPPSPSEAQPTPPRPKANPRAADIEAHEKAPPTKPAEQPKQRADDAPKTPPAQKQVELPKQLPQPEPKQQQKLTLQFDMPPPTAFSPGTRGAAVSRPAGITRSGENDEFGRGVIRALRKTMPASNVLGRVTVRLLISQTGNLVEVRLVSGGGDPILSQNVVFAVKQSSFPFPPPGATEVDRTFQVTYVYH